jgi:predicted nuclease of restriction endonuclease-like (RecB) superfamily
MSKDQISKIPTSGDYGLLVDEIGKLLEQSRRQAARTINNLLTATYWEIGRRIVEFEQGGEARAEYGGELLVKLSADLTARYGRGFSRPGLQRMRTFYLEWEICSTPSSELEARAGCAELYSQSGFLPVPKDIEPIGPPLRLSTQALMGAFRLSWSHYVRLMSVDKPVARVFYENEAIRGGWSVRQLDRQISTQFFERTAKSKRQEAMLARGQKALPEDAITADEEIRNPYLLEFLNLKDEYSEYEMEEALIRHMEWFLLEMGSGFTFVARQKRIRVGSAWYRIDLLLYHRVLRCLVLIDLKRGAFTHADAGQMNLYLNYAKEHLALADENDPVGIILCGDHDDAVVKYATAGMQAQVFASKYLTELPDEETLRREIVATRKALAERIK